MPNRIIASIVVGSLLAVSESIFILLSCGPFWFGPALILKTWLIYSALALPGMIITGALFLLFFSSEKNERDRTRRLFYRITILWALSSAVLIALVKQDLDIKGPHLQFGLVLLLVGVSSIFLLRTWSRNPDTFARNSTILATGWIGVALAVYVLSSHHFEALIKQRGSGFRSEAEHVCLVVFDATRGEHLSCYGYSHNTSPNIDRIASEGLLCLNTYSAANWTPPGHISIFTGKYPSQHGNNGEPYMPDDLISLAEILSQEGYFCIAIYDNLLAGRDVNITQGFDRDYSFFRNTWAYPAPFRLWDKMILRHSGSKAIFELAGDLYTWVAAHHGHLFLFVNVLEAHTPYETREPFFAYITGGLDPQKIENLEQISELCNTQENTIYDSARFTDCSADGYAFIRGNYDSEIAYMDHHFGRFADRLRRESLLDETLLILTADHGEFLGEHFTIGHPKLLFNPVLRIPMIWRFPDEIPPGIYDGYASNVDILPTSLQLIGLGETIPSDVEGINLLHSGGSVQRILQSSSLSRDGVCFSVIADRYKLILNRDAGLLRHFPYEILLFDLQNDPQESTDLTGIEAALRDDLQRKLEDWVQRIEVHPEEKFEITPQNLANLKALGYVH
jgi:arylsulfatase A-like enzyme